MGSRRRFLRAPNHGGIGHLQARDMRYAGFLHHRSFHFITCTPTFGNSASLSIRFYVRVNALPFPFLPPVLHCFYLVRSYFTTHLCRHHQLLLHASIILPPFFHFPMLRHSHFNLSVVHATITTAVVAACGFVSQPPPAVCPSLGGFVITQVRPLSIMQWHDTARPSRIPMQGNLEGLAVSCHCMILRERIWVITSPPREGQTAGGG